MIAKGGIYKVFRNPDTARKNPNPEPEPKDRPLTRFDSEVMDS